MRRNGRSVVLKGPNGTTNAFKGTLNTFDWVVCHAEGKIVAGATDTAGQPHQDGKIDLRNIDAKVPSAADNKFTFIAAEGSDFSGAKGELRWMQENHSGTSNDKTLVMGDVDGDGKADFVLEISGLHTMQAVDFLL